MVFFALALLAVSWPVESNAAPPARQGVGLHAAQGPLHWKDGAVSIFVSRTVHLASGETGVDSRENAESVQAAVEGALRQWAGAPWAAVQVTVGLTDDQAVTPDRSLVTFTDPAPFDNGTCSRLWAACTLVYFYETGEIASASVAFNPYLRFSSVGLEGTFDLWAVMLHEAGHVFGLDHSGLLNSAMSPFVEAVLSATPPVFTPREVGMDDRLSLAELYPSPEASAALGKVEGRALLDGGPLAGGHVLAIAEDGTPARDTLTDREGRYGLLLEPGSYTLIIEPLDGPVTAGHMTQPVEDSAALFPTLFWNSAGGDSHAGESVAVEAGAVRSADFAVPSGEASNLRLVAAVIPGQPSYYLPQITLARGGEYLVSAIRTPMTGDPALRLSGPFEAASETSIGPDPDLAERTIAIPADAPVGSYNVHLHNGSSGAVLAGGVRITVRPQVSAVLNAGDGQLAEAFRPGQEILVQGSDLAAGEAVADGATRAAGTSVRIGGRFAPLVSVSPTEIRARIPFGIDGERTELTVIAGPDSSSTAVELRLSLD